MTGSQAVARIADHRTASQHIGVTSLTFQSHVTSSVNMSICHFLLVILRNGVSKSSHFRDSCALSVYWGHEFEFAPLSPSPYISSRFRDTGP